MRQPIFQPALLRDLKRIKKRGRDIEKLLAVVRLLARDGKLAAQYRPHKLGGEWQGLWECHIQQDWLLVYKVDESQVLLFRTGSHTDLFG